MSKSKKILLTFGIVALVLVVAGLILSAVFLNDIVKKGVETVGPLITKVPVTVDEVQIGLASGSAKVKDLVVGNPEGYKSPSAISVGLAQVGVNPFSILSDKIVIRSIRVVSPEISFEGNPLGKNNLGEIMENVNAMTKNGGPPTTPATTKTGAKPTKKFQVDEFLITGAKVHVTLTGLGSLNGKETTQTLPDIRVTGLGKGGDGITSAELTRIAMSAITSATIKAVASSAADLGKDTDKIKKDFNHLFGK